MLIMEILYCITVIFWGGYAAKQQRKNYPDSTVIKCILVLIINAIFAPLCILVALYKEK